MENIEIKHGCVVKDGKIIAVLDWDALWDKIWSTPSGCGDPSKPFYC